MIRHFFLGLTLMMSTQLSGLAQSEASVILRIEDSGVLRLQSMVAPGRLSVAWTVTYCTRVLASHPSTRVGIVEVFEGPPYPSKIPAGSSHYSFKEFLHLYDSYASGIWRSARCLLTPENGSFVIRLGGRVEKGLLYGAEFPEVVVDGLRADAVHISPGIPVDKAVVDTLTVFVLTDRMPSPEAAVVIAAHMRSYFGPKVRVVNIQDCPLFSFHEEFPVYPIYTYPVRPATNKEYYRQYLRCGFDEQFACRDAL